MSVAPPPLLDVEHLTMRFGGLIAIDDLSFAAARGEITAIIMIGGTEIMRELDFLKLVFGNEFDPTQYRMLLFGFAMVLIMVWKPRGFVLNREPSVKLASSSTPDGHRVEEKRA